MAPYWTSTYNTRAAMQQNTIDTKAEYVWRRAAQKWEGALRLGLVHAFSGSMPYYIVNEYPKSGGSWISQMLADALALPFPRNRFPVFRPSIMQGHYFWRGGLKNVVVVWRDPRDLMISFYYHCYFQNERGNAPLVRKMRKALPFQRYEALDKNLPEFLEVMLSGRAPWPRHPWPAFVTQWANSPRTCHVTYEDMRNNPRRTLNRLCYELAHVGLSEERNVEIIEKHSFEKQSGRKPGEENNRSFVRKGVVGDWRNYFTRESAAVLEHYAGDGLRCLGYEADGSWVARCK